ncbi:MAG TPA: sigma-70 family RNA polymerase sigma factor [Pyrinomonadaceae bacterium]|nr:sigma-70 family RNA polymerase sigma factor [Pyrinomonadaceae bacterium]
MMIESRHFAGSMTTTVPTEDLTELLLEWQNGDSVALEKLTPLVYDELRRIAHRYMQRERSGHTLQTTALVHEAFVRLVDDKKMQLENRTHFFALMARVMRHVLTDHARRKGYAKHGGAMKQVSLPESDLMSLERASELVALDEALLELASIDLRKSQVVELRYFGGLSLEETAEVMAISVMTVRRDWRVAKAWLFRELHR